MTRVAFVCVGNAGRSQMATAFAERERERRDLEIEIVTGGTDPADRVHEDAIEVLREEGIDIGDRSPRKIAPEDVADADHVVTMGCSIDEFRPEGWEGQAETWDFDRSGSDDREATREQRDEIERRVVDFFDRLEA